MEFSWLDEFYKYSHRRLTNDYLGYHTEPVLPYDITGENTILNTGWDDSRPFFIHHGKDEPLCNLHRSEMRRGMVLEVGFTVTPDQIYLAANEDEYFELTRHPYGGGHLGFSERGVDLIDQHGKRWFILANHSLGENESFIAYPSTIVKSVDILQAPGVGGHCPIFLR
jgi:hypothetical protein